MAAKDPNEFARSVLDQIIATHDPEASREQENPKAVALGSRGGAKGGHSSAKKLSAKRRKAIAKKAAKARWKEMG